MISCLLDDSSVLALGKGYPALSGFIVDANTARYRGTGVEPIDPGVAG